jgi:hypothetical protein
MKKGVEDNHQDGKYNQMMRNLKGGNERKLTEPIPTIPLDEEKHKKSQKEMEKQYVSSCWEHKHMDLKGECKRRGGVRGGMSGGMREIVTLTYHTPQHTGKRKGGEHSHTQTPHTALTPTNHWY